VDDDVNDFYPSAPRHRGGRKKRKKNKEIEAIPEDFDAIYDPRRPIVYEYKMMAVTGNGYDAALKAYKNSDEYFYEKLDWRDRRYAHRRRSPRAGSSYSNNSSRHRYDGPSQHNAKFAPPSFAPPPNYDDDSRASSVGMEDDATGDNAYMSRSRLSPGHAQQSPAFQRASHASANEQFPIFSQSRKTSESPSPPLSLGSPQRTQNPASDQAFQRFARPEFMRANQALGSLQSNPSAEFVQLAQPPGFILPNQTPPNFLSTQAPTFLSSSTLEAISSPLAPIPSYSSTVISAAPVRYDLSAPPTSIPRTDEDIPVSAEHDQDETMEDAEDAPRSTRPGQKDFAARMMKKMGWEKGQGLGAEGTGITTALKVQVVKAKKKPDALGGGFAGPSGMGKIVGGKKKKGAEDNEVGMSTVVVCRHMVDGLDLDFEMGPEGNLVDEIGQECGAKVYRIPFPSSSNTANLFTVRHYRARSHQPQHAI
jgi:splicing factor 45